MTSTDSQVGWARRLVINWGRGHPGIGKKPLTPIIRPAIPAELRRMRIARGMSLVAFEKHSGFDRSLIGRWERGENSPKLRHLIDWADALGFKLKLDRK